ncbi:MAG: BON domain-containing protein [Vicinamibacterales bacterium]
MRMTAILLSGACLLPAMAAAAVSSQQPETTSSSVAPDTAMATATATAMPAATSQDQSDGAPDTMRHAMTNADVLDAVEDELLVDRRVPSRHVTVQFVDGIVTLTGTVDNLVAKERAARIAETVKGVQSVVNRITVQPIETRTGAELRGDVVHALAVDPATESYEVDVSATDDGQVTLQGEVDSWAEQHLAGLVTKGVAGVTALQNNIEVRPSAMRPDAEIAADIRGRIDWSTLVDGALVTVDVDDGAVNLTGTVGSAAEKRQAGLLAWTSGVRTVDTDGLTVSRWARDPDLREKKYVNKPDGEVQQAVENALLLDPRVNSQRVDASVDHGLVTLRGTVTSPSAAEAARTDARHTVGVGSVRDHLKVEPASARSDAAIASDVRDAIGRNAFLDRQDVTVTAINGTAYLYGTVDSYLEKVEAERAASHVRGVAEVANELVVRQPAWMGYDPYVDDASIYDYPWYTWAPAHSWTPDHEIQDDIESQLWWSPFVDSDEVTVTVDDGVARLTGTVDSWSEYNAATDNAFEGGAVWVDNDLVVDVG